jgi:hypothetical protein
MKSMSVCVVLKVLSVEFEVDVEAVGGTSEEAASEAKVGRLCGAVSEVLMEDRGLVVAPMVCMMRADLVGRASTSSRIMGGKSPLRTDGNEMNTRSR